MNTISCRFFVLFFSCMLASVVIAQTTKSNTAKGIYIDKQGVMRWKDTDAEASFFGVNYTVPFAYGYRSHKALGVDIEKAIDADVYHMARLGLNAFRVHVWDTEITDAKGNLLLNEHLRLFDYLIFKLKERNIKILITPIAFWGNGYPEKDEKTAGFSSVYTKQKALINDTAIAAQENYLKQFFKHVNPYTKLSYQDDEDVIAMEINNEPQHSGPKPNVTNYVNRMAKAVKSTGWTKPVFYNISESPAYADAVANAAIDGVSFQWYPTGLVANHTLQGNMLPNIDQYYIPFADTIAKFAGKAKMVYEFDAGDVLQPIMYPAMARSFRTAGFQWATQFAYDPLATAYGNTEYQTHFLNLAYTPSKAISLMIAAKAFHEVPRLKQYGKFPADTLFESFRISYQQQVCELVSKEHFYYANSTNTVPTSVQTLKHVAGVGNSSLVNYDGAGAYFLDKITDGVWRLEVMPDAVVVADPFGSASPKRDAVQLFNRPNQFTIHLADLGSNFIVRGINQDNKISAAANGNKVILKAGTYLLMNASLNAFVDENLKLNNLRLNEFVMPLLKNVAPVLLHEPYAEVSANTAIPIHFKYTAFEKGDSALVQFGKLNWQLKSVIAMPIDGYQFKAEISQESCTPGLVQYRIIIKKANGKYIQYPGAVAQNPFDWDNYHHDFYQTKVAVKASKFELFNAERNRQYTMLYLPDWRTYNSQYVSSSNPQQLALQLNGNAKTDTLLFGMQHYFGDILKGRSTELSSFSKLIIRARVINQPNALVQIGLIDNNAACFTKTISLDSEFRDIECSITELHPDKMLLLPRPYPGFQPLWFRSASTAVLDLSNVEKFQLVVDGNLLGSNRCSIEVESVWLK